jgi:hypothetical protein
LRLLIVLQNVAREAHIMTDEYSGYRHLNLHFAGHGTTSHSRGEYVTLEDRAILSNTIEGLGKNLSSSLSS